ncbi:MAG: hypothetical protein OXG47_09300 [bacterium]|nr:hypothetical protein [bacterium]
MTWERYNADMWAAQLTPSGGGFARGVMIRREGRRYIAATIAMTPVTAPASASLAAAKQAAQQLVDGVL